MAASGDFYNPIHYMKLFFSKLSNKSGFCDQFGNSAELVVFD